MGNQNSLDFAFYGYRIYSIIENGPMDKTKEFKPLEDFIIPPEEFKQDKILFLNYLEKNINKRIELNVYNLKTRSFKSITVTPSNDWDKSNKHKSILGGNVRYENYATAHKNVLRLIRIKHDSILFDKGLIEREDFLIALKKKNFDIISLNTQDNCPLEFLTDILNYEVSGNPCEMEFIFYNRKSGFKSVEVSLTSEKLNCEFAFGSLHEFPQELDYKNDSVV